MNNIFPIEFSILNGKKNVFYILSYNPNYIFINTYFFSKSLILAYFL